MSKTIRPTWTCLRCRQQQLVPKRRLTTATAATIPKFLDPQTSAKHDDTTLRQIFDSQVFWQDFSESRRSWTGKRVGLFQNQYLQTPQGFHAFAEVTLQKCQDLVDRILAISTLDGYRSIVQLLDRLSDLLCRIIDIADFVRSTHPDPAFQHAAAQAHYRMFEYMNILNTTTGLNDQLKLALEDPNVTSSWTEEELIVAQILRKDFSQSAIDLPKAKRRKFVELSNTINEIGSQFLDSMRPASYSVTFKSERLGGLDPRVVRRYTNRRGDVELPSHGSIVSHVLARAHDESVRKEMYITSRIAASEEISMLEKMLKARAELASLCGYDSYASRALTDKMARTPEAVNKFLEALADNNRPHVKDELANLLRAKQNHLSESNELNPWDRDYYRDRVPNPMQRPTRNSDMLPSYFSLGTVIQGLSRLFSRLYGVRFQPVEPLPGETWSPEVRRLDVIDEKHGRIAVVYCDLFAREGKSPNPAHFTLRCSRLITSAEIAENASAASSTNPVDPVALANDGMATSSLGPDGAFQLPTIALICDFPPPASPRVPPLLPTSHLTTLFHEMGHAIHSILGRTTLQNVSGTRCATDFAELPSILMENFATNPAVLSLYARHWETDAPLPLHLAEQIQRNALAADGPKEGAADTEWQILLSLFDQAYHSPLAAKSDFDSTSVTHNVYRQYASFKEPSETKWQGFFGHLVGYGGSYYAYLFDRAIAKRVWEVVFSKGEGNAALERERGESFRKEVLGWGGSREPWTSVASVLKDDRLRNGGEEAMKLVGGWGVS
jgi:mitochondrial intermediate peptidase